MKEVIVKPWKGYETENKQTFNRASSLLIRILLESKRNPWNVYINTLIGSVDGLYPHSVEMALISMMMADEWGYSESVICKMGLGALLHDIGLLFIPRKIVLKDKDRNGEEESIFRRHCLMGWNHVSGCSLSIVTRDIILQHHERLNGSGYPRHLKGNDISGCVKIAMIADSFHDVTTGNAAMTPEMALAELRSQKGAYSKEHLEVLEHMIRRKG